MKSVRDAIVIGAGIVGCATALALVRGGSRRVTLIDKGPLASGMTRRNPGLVHPFQPHPALAALAEPSFDFYSQWVQNLGGRSSFIETGAAVVTNLDATSQFAQWTGLADVRELSPDALRAHYPAVANDFRTIFYTPRAGYGDAVLTAQAMIAVAKDHGLEIQTGAQVKQIVVTAKQIQGVKTTTGEIDAPVVIVTAGAWSERILSALGVSLPLRLRREVVMFCEQPKTVADPLPMFVDANGAYFFRPHPYHMTAAGRAALERQTGGVEQLDDYVSAHETTRLSQFVQACVPGMANVSPKRAHALFLDAPADGLPFVGAIDSVHGLLVAAGFGASAFAVAPTVGEALVEIVRDGASSRDLAAFHPLRSM